MNSYWDAVARAALGLRGSAEPKPRSMFELDETDPTLDDFEALEQEIDAQPTRPAATPPPPALPSPESMAGHPGQAAAQSPGLPPSSQPNDVAHQRSDALSEAGAPQPHTSATFDDRVKQNSPPQPSAASTHVRVHRIETTRTIVEAGDTRVPPASPEAAGWKPFMQEPAPLRDTPAKPAASAAPVTIEPPSVSVAEPLSPSPILSRQQPAAELPPLVIEIGRIDIRIASEAAPSSPPAKQRDVGTVPSLSDYLALRSKAER